MWKPKRALGRLYFEGRPESVSNTGNGSIVSSFTPAVEQDVAGAVKWLRKAAKRGHTEAKCLLETVLAKAKRVY